MPLSCRCSFLRGDRGSAHTGSHLSETDQIPNVNLSVNYYIFWGRRKSHHGNLPRRLPVEKQNKILGFLGGHHELGAKIVDKIRPCSWCSRSTREPPHRNTAPRNTLAPGSPAGSPQSSTCSPAWIAKTHCWSVAP